MGYHTQQLIHYFYILIQMFSQNSSFGFNCKILAFSSLEIFWLLKIGNL